MLSSSSAWPACCLFCCKHSSREVLFGSSFFVAFVCISRPKHSTETHDPYLGTSHSVIPVYIVGASNPISNGTQFKLRRLTTHPQLLCRSCFHLERNQFPDTIHYVQTWHTSNRSLLFPYSGYNSETQQNIIDTGLRSGISFLSSLWRSFQSWYSVDPNHTSNRTLKGINRSTPNLSCKSAGQDQNRLQKITLRTFLRKTTTRNAKDRSDGLDGSFPGRLSKVRCFYENLNSSGPFEC